LKYIDFAEVGQARLQEGVLGKGVANFTYKSSEGIISKNWRLQDEIEHDSIGLHVLPHTTHTKIDEEFNVLTE